MREAPTFGGKYRVIRSLARGGMGEVLLATHEGPGGFARQVVIKTLLPGLSGESALIEMFLDEARLAAQLTHPNIVQVYDFGQEADCYFMVMEYLRGETLSRLIRSALAAGRRLGPGFVAAVGSQVCSGLGYAHALRSASGEPLAVVHRDISPQNILVCEEGVAKVLDFGIAKAAWAQSRTQAGTVKGKPSYMSPEQIRGRPLDGRSDLFSLGIVLWECLAGKRLFTASNPLEAMEKICRQPAPPLASAAPDVPPALAAVVERALERDPQRRFQTAAEMGRALDAFLYGLGNLNAQDEILAGLRGTAPERVQSPGLLADAGAGRADPLAAWIPAWASGEVDPFAGHTATAAAPAARAPEPLLAPAAGLPPAADEPLELAWDPRAGREPEPPAPQEAAPPRPAAPARVPAGESGRPERPAPAPASSRRGAGALAIVGGVVVALGVVGWLGFRALGGGEEAIVEYGIAEGMRAVPLELASVPQGARVFVDGEDTGEVTPTTVMLETGREHQVVLRHPAFLPYETEAFAVPNKPMNLNAVLTPGARVTVVSDPPGAEVELDGKVVFRAPGTTDALAEGRHELILRLPGRVTERRVLEIEDSEPLTLSIQLAAGIDVPVVSTPPGASILVDGEDTGQVTPAVVTVPTGRRHTVGVRLEGFLPQRKAAPRPGREPTTLEFVLVNAQVAELRARIASLETELRAWEKKADALRRQQSGSVVVRSVRSELALRQLAAEAEARVEDLSAEVADLHDELAAIDAASAAEAL